ncbi:(2Fe-2S)-binding protein [Shewanella algae]|uniref:(2Fe-2S)-binding protein n=1 Tax=Shewanella algae TaxID=38313 RepID=A0AAD1KER7_9GAMM|nr:(2Fe-2S)-binding protein [Shewanella algae]MBO2597116.1 (2Fe-2S)-binding protein [Shewanella algae]MBO2668468.1 (2Fe-2S)-binding protein [Shewanella algae]BCV46977.1 (2Fe-2S)-binding protein [Shewanella algae]
MSQLKINGRLFSVEADPNMPLLWALRDLLGLTGTKFGCGAGLCGACTIHLDGKPARACLTSLKSAKGKNITTIEGLDNPALKAAWSKHKVPQCGYCQTGQLMSAAALLSETPNPSDQQINDAMSGNICRCGTYTRIRSAIKDIAAKGGVSS